MWLHQQLYPQLGYFNGGVQALQIIVPVILGAIYIYMYIYMYMYVYVHMCVHMHMYMYVHITGRHLEWNIANWAKWGAPKSCFGIEISQYFNY